MKTVSIATLWTCANNGLSINQTFRKLNLGNEIFIRRAIVNEPELSLKFRENGAIRKKIGGSIQRRKIKTE